jgi:hypothetical protein
MPPQRRTGAAAYGQAATRPRAAQKPIAIPPAPGTPDRRKYTVRIDAGPADRFERAVLALTLEVGRKLDKSEVMRELAEMLADDQTVAKMVADRLRRRM